MPSGTTGWLVGVTMRGINPRMLLNKTKRATQVVKA